MEKNAYGMLMVVFLFFLTKQKSHVNYIEWMQKWGKTFETNSFRIFFFFPQLKSNANFVHFKLNEKIGDICEKRA